MKNKKNTLKFQVYSAIFVLILGTLLHFTYEWSGENKIVGLFSAVNESTWEHLKITFFPMLISTIVGYFLLKKDSTNFLCAKTIGILSTLSFIVITFYTFNGIVGTNYDFVNIAIFIIGVILGEYISYRIMMSNYICNHKTAITVLVILFVCFITFTYNTPKLGIFKDPITGEYGATT